jgi:outer membrane murein-binding lipoprotein Lpp
MTEKKPSRIGKLISDAESTAIKALVVGFFGLLWAGYMNLDNYAAENKRYTDAAVDILTSQIDELHAKVDKLSEQTRIVHRAIEMMDPSALRHATLEVKEIEAGLEPSKVNTREMIQQRIKD